MIGKIEYKDFTGWSWECPTCECEVVEDVDPIYNTFVYCDYCGEGFYPIKSILVKHNHKKE